MNQNGEIRKKHEEKLESILSQLIAMPTVSGNYEANHDGLEYISAFLEERGINVKHFEWNQTESLVATTRNTKTPVIMLYGHLDVVPASPELFQMKKDRSKYYGRGVFDMKFAIAIYLCLVDDLRDKLAQYDLGIMITTDEEVSGANGSKRLVEEGYFGQVMLMPDSGGKGWEIETVAKGVWHFTVMARGKSAHGSRPWEGDNAINRLIDALADIKKIFPMKNRYDSTINIGVIHGGTMTNQIPAEAYANLDIRIGNIEDEKRLLVAIRKICDTHKVTIEKEMFGNICLNDPENPYIAKFADTVERTVGQKPGFFKAFGGSDGRYFASRGIPCIITAPEGGAHHSDQEWISKKGVQQFYEVTKAYIEEIAI